ncbi:hypothetical protein CAPTEDRAFT_125820, partial [Capitella teleta]
KKQIISILSIVAKIVGLITLLYFFICSLDLLSSAFTLIGGRSAGNAFSNPIIQNPICGLMIGVVSTAFLQSSSTSSSIIITMVAAGLLGVPTAIPIIMGTNIGTSVTGILVSVTQAGDREVFRKAFSAATVHDMFNWLTVIILLPLEIIAGYLYHMTTALVNAADLTTGGDDQKFLKVITEPLTNLIVQVDKKVLDEIAAGKPGSENKSLLKEWCEYEVYNVTTKPDITSKDSSPCSPLLCLQQLMEPNNVRLILPDKHGIVCMVFLVGVYIFQGTTLSEAEVGAIVLVMSLILLIAALILMVKILKSLLQGSMASVIQRTINADFPGRAACLTGYVAILVGAIVTMLVQSSSVVASALTPLVGLGVVSVERVYPMMLGANIGTTSTAILAAFAASGDSIQASFQIAMCHLFFNLTGIIIWYPLPFMRSVPISLAKYLGSVTSEYRWFAVMYLIMMFFLIPLTIFALSIPGWYVLAAVGIPIILLMIAIGIINIIQSKKPNWLPAKMRTWEFLPEPLRSLKPLDRIVTRVLGCCCKCCTIEQDAGSLQEVKDAMASIDEKKGESKAEPSNIAGIQNKGMCTISELSYFHESGV